MRKIFLNFGLDSISKRGIGLLCHNLILVGFKGEEKIKRKGENTQKDKYSKTIVEKMQNIFLNFKHIGEGGIALVFRTLISL
jgi:hypothetical protein